MDIRFTGAAAQSPGGHDGLVEHARRRLDFRLRHRSERVAHVSVRFGATGSRRGRRDTYCVMRVQLRGAPAATVVDIGADLHDTIDRAADRIGRLADERLREADGKRMPPVGSAAMAA